MSRALMNPPECGNGGSMGYGVIAAVEKLRNTPTGTETTAGGSREKRKLALDLHLVSAACLLTIWQVNSGVTAHDVAGVAV